MQSASISRSLPFSDVRTYLFAALFTIGNILLPQLLHTVSLGGVTWLPIYFFTLVGSFVYGWRVGVLVALASPVINSLIFGMPPVAALPAILMKSVLLAVVASLTFARFGRATIALLTAVVIGYQALGTLGEWALSGNLMLACQDFRIGIPGMLLQIFGGWAVINYILKK